MAEKSETYLAGGSPPVPPVTQPATSEDVILATATAFQIVLYDGSPARLEMEFQVLDDDEYTSRRAYYGQLYLHVASKRHYVGYVLGHLVLKPSTARPDLNPQTWIDDWLARPVHSYNDADAELMCALRALYKRTGRPRYEGNGLDHTDTLVFIQKVYIRQKSEMSGLHFAGKGLLTHAFALYYRAFTSAVLPEPYRISGTAHFILEPALPASETEARVWEQHRPKTSHHPPTEAEEDAFVEEVAKTLEKIYKRPSIGYEVRARDVAIGGANGTIHTILGRRLEASPPRPGEDFGTITFLPTFSSRMGTSSGTPSSSSLSRQSSASTMSQGVHEARPSSLPPFSPVSSQHEVSPPTSQTTKRKRDCDEGSTSEYKVQQPNGGRHEEKKRRGEDKV